MDGWVAVVLGLNKVLDEQDDGHDGKVDDSINDSSSDLM